MDFRGSSTCEGTVVTESMLQAEGKCISWVEGKHLLFRLNLELCRR